MGSRGAPPLNKIKTAFFIAEVNLLQYLLLTKCLKIGNKCQVFPTGPFEFQRVVLLNSIFFYSIICLFLHGSGFYLEEENC